LELGYSIDEIADQTIAAEKVRSERAESNQAQKWDKVSALSERFGRVLRKALPGTSPNKMTVAANTA
jgi:hypothetical protein